MLLTSWYVTDYGADWRWGC